MSEKKIRMLSLTISAVLLTATVALAVEGIYQGKRYVVITEEKSLDENGLNIGPFILGHSTLQDVLHKIVRTTIQERHYVSGHYNSQVCYETSGMTLLLNSQMERGDPQVIDDALISSGKISKERYGSCMTSADLKPTMTFLGGAHLGMSSEEVRKLWGKPGKIDGNILVYDIRRLQHEFFTDDVSLYFKFKNDKLIFVDASRVAVR